MVNIKIETSQIAGVAESISKYVRLDLIDNDERANMLWFCGSLDFVKRLRKSADTEDDTVTISLDDRLVNDLSEIISKYIFKEIKELELADDEWMEEMASVYMQLEQAKQKKTKPAFQKTQNPQPKEQNDSKKNKDVPPINIF